MFDRVAAVILLIMVTPVILPVIISLAITNKGRVWYIQPRPGYREKLFNILKFRTMTDKRDDDGDLLPDEHRLTLIGKLVRKFSLDELPQLVNVLRGDMSIVGPRPLLEEYLPLYSAEQKRRHEVKPGITGWAQVNGRNTLSWQEKFQLDCWYVGHISFLLDLQILFLTIIKVFKSEGISSSTSATMEKFRGEG